MTYIHSLLALLLPEVPLLRVFASESLSAWTIIMIWTRASSVYDTQSTQVLTQFQLSSALPHNRLCPSCHEFSLEHKLTSSIRYDSRIFPKASQSESPYLSSPPKWITNSYSLEVCRTIFKRHTFRKKVAASVSLGALLRRQHYNLKGLLL